MQLVLIGRITSVSIIIIVSIIQSQESEQLQNFRKIYYTIWPDCTNLIISSVFYSQLARNENCARVGGGVGGGEWMDVFTWSLLSCCVSTFITWEGAGWGVGGGTYWPR